MMQGVPAVSSLACRGMSASPRIFSCLLPSLLMLVVPIIQEDGCNLENITIFPIIRVIYFLNIKVFLSGIDKNE